MTGVPTHAPFWHSSEVVQTFPSLHAVPLVAGVVVQTPLSQASVVHGFPSWHWALLVHPPAPPELEPLELPLLNPLELPDPLELPELEPLELLAPLELPELLDAPELDPLELAPLELPELAPSEASAASASASLAPASTPESSLGTPSPFSSHAPPGHVVPLAAGGLEHTPVAVLQLPAT